MMTKNKRIVSDIYNYRLLAQGYLQQFIADYVIQKKAGNDHECNIQKAYLVSKENGEIMQAISDILDIQPDQLKKKMLNFIREIEKEI